MTLFRTGIRKNLSSEQKEILSLELCKLQMEHSFFNSSRFLSSVVYHRTNYGAHGNQNTITGKTPSHLNDKKTGPSIVSQISTVLHFLALILWNPHHP